jgi:hypothetical protein
MTHPSYLELDRVALGAARETTTAAHVTGCDRCRHYLDGLRDVPPLPAGLRERVAAAPVPGVVAGLLAKWFGGRHTRLFGATALAGAMAATAVFWLGHRSPPSPSRAGSPAADYDGVKGLPSVWIYVKHDNELALWDGERPLAPGDRLRLKIDPQELSQVDVFSVDDEGSFRRVYSGQLARGAVTTLPAAWQLDDRSQRESLIVVLSNAPVSATAAKRFAEAGAPAGVWLRRFELRPGAPAREGRPR